MNAGAEFAEAVRLNRVAILSVAALCGVCALALASYLTPRAEVVAYVEIARLFRSDPDGSLRDELVLSPVVLASQVNSGAFSRDGRTRIVARVPVKTDNLELTARGRSHREASEALNALVERINREHAAVQLPFIESSRKKFEQFDAELAALQGAYNKADSGLLAFLKGGNPKDAMQYFILTSLRAQLNKEMRELRGARQGHAEAVELMRAHQTRVIGNPVSRQASLLPALVAAVFGALLGGVFAALVFGVIHRRRAHRPDA